MFQHVFQCGFCFRLINKCVRKGDKCSTRSPVPYRRHLIFHISLKNPKNRLSHPIVTPLMLVTTYYHPRSPPHPDEFNEIEGPWPPNGLPGAIGEDGDRDDLIGGSQAGLYSSASDEGEQHSVVAWGPNLRNSKRKSGIKKRATIRNSTTPLKVFRTPSRAIRHVNRAYSNNAALGQAPQVGESCVPIEVSRKIQEDWR